MDAELGTGAQRCGRDELGLGLGLGIPGGLCVEGPGPTVPRGSQTRPVNSPEDPLPLVSLPTATGPGAGTGGCQALGSQLGDRAALSPLVLTREH